MIPKIVNLSVGSAVFNGLKIEFEVNAAYRKLISGATIKVFNLTDDTHSSLNRADEVTLSIGGSSGSEILFFGGLVNKEKIRKGPDIISILHCRAGFSEYENKKIKNTFKKGTTGKQVFDWIKREYKKYEFVITDEDLEKINKKVFPGGLTFPPSKASFIFERFFRIENKIPYKYDNKSIIIGNPKHNSFLISEKTGMVNSPSIGAAVAEVSSVIIPRLRPGDVITIDSRYYTYQGTDKKYYEHQKSSGSGSYILLNYIHRGDSHSEDAMTSRLYLVGAKQ